MTVRQGWNYDEQDKVGQEMREGRTFGAAGKKRQTCIQKFNELTHCLSGCCFLQRLFGAQGSWFSSELWQRVLASP